MRCPRNEDGEKSKVYVEKWKNIRRRNSIAAKNYFSLETRVHVRYFLCLKSERTNRNRGTPRFLDNKKIWVEKGRKERNARGRVSNNVSNTDEIVKVRSIFTSKAVSCLFLFCKTANENLKFRNISNTTFLHMSIIYNLSLRGKIFANYKRFVVMKIWTLLKAFNFSKGTTNLFV